MAGLDAFAKRFYPAIVCGLLGAVAYLQGSGISSLISEQITGRGRAPAPSARAGKPPKTTGLGDKTGAEILSRNPFDSVTGPIRGTGPAKPVTSAAPVAHTPVAGEPSKCSDGDVFAITSASDPALSFAMIKKGTETRLRRVGDSIDSYQVEQIDKERVILASGTSRCQLTMHEGVGTVGAMDTQVGPSEPRFAEESTPIPSPTTLGGMGAGPIAGIRKESDTSYVLEDNAPAKLQMVKDAFVKSAKLVDGEGLRLYRSSSTTILGQLGMKKGDMVKTVNGHDMSVLDQSATAYAELKNASAVTIVVERDGQPVTIQIKTAK